jgi:Mn-dependent DtxR family transcriptional regulator
MRRGEVTRGGDGGFRLTSAGRVEAVRILRNHRLWELYLIRHADIAPSHVDRDADDVEHVLSEPIVRELERALDEAVAIPPSPHAEGGGV